MARDTHGTGLNDSGIHPEWDEPIIKGKPLDSEGEERYSLKDIIY